MLEYLKHYNYAFKYDDVIKHTKREIAKTRKAAREANSSKAPKVVPNTDHEDEAEYNDINIIDHYNTYFAAFKKMYPQDEKMIIYSYEGDYQKLKSDHGYRHAYAIAMDRVCVNVL